MDSPTPEHLGHHIGPSLGPHVDENADMREVAKRLSPPETRAAALIAELLLQEPLLHGDANHRAWLSNEILRRIPEMAKIIKSTR